MRRKVVEKLHNSVLAESFHPAICACLIFSRVSWFASWYNLFARVRTFVGRGQAVADFGQSGAAGGSSRAT